MARHSFAKRQFKVVIERDANGYFFASVPALPGCHTQAKTFPELSERVRDAINICLSVAETDAHYRARIRQFVYEPSFVGMEVVALWSMKGRMPTLKVRDVMRALRSLGSSPVRQSGSHVFFQHPDGRTTLVPRHTREDIGRGLLRQILREVNMTPQQFAKYL